MTNQNEPRDKYLALGEVLKMVPVSATTWRRRVTARLAPQPIKFDGSRRLFFLKSEIEEYLANAEAKRSSEND